MDIIDLAQNEIESYHAGCKRNSTHKEELLTPDGFCHYCDEVVGDKQLFCNGDHATKYALRAKRKL